MNDSKNFASLGPTLLARKGSAKPAMRSQHFNPPTGAAAAQAAAKIEEDLGWDDMGEEDTQEHSATVLSLTPAQPSTNDDDDDDASPLIAGNDVDEVHTVDKADNDSDGELALAEEDDAAEFSSEDLDDDLDSDDFDVASDEDTDAEVAKWIAKKPDVRVQQEKLADTLGAEDESEEAELPKKKKKSGRKGKSSSSKKGGRAAFTLRLDAERHLKLRLACTINNQSAQQLVTEALDDYLANIEDVEALASQLKKQKN